MFLRRKKPLPVTRVLDVPIPIRIEPTRLLAKLSDDTILIWHGNFENISDADATLKVQKCLDKYAS